MHTTYTLIIVPLDGSAAAEKALPVARRLAHCTGATLHLVRAVPQTRAAEHALDVGLVRPTDHVAAEAASYLQRIAHELREDQLVVQTTLWRGDATEGILAAVEQNASALVLLVSGGRTSRGRWLLGSVARRVLRDSPVPVLLLRDDGRPLPPTSPYTALPRTALQVMVPLDGTPQAEAALEPALDLLVALAAAGEGRLHLVHVIPSFGGDWGLDEPRARAYLQAAAERVAGGRPRALGHRVTWSLLFETEAAHAIVRLGAEGDGHGPPASVIVMAGGGQRVSAQTRPMQRILGGVTERVLHGSRVPVMVIGRQMARRGAADTSERDAASTIHIEPPASVAVHAVRAAILASGRPPASEGFERSQQS